MNQDCHRNPPVSASPVPALQVYIAMPGFSVSSGNPKLGVNARAAVLYRVNHLSCPNLQYFYG